MTTPPDKPGTSVPVPEDPHGKPRRRLGFLKGQIEIPEDFDTMCQEEIIRLFEGEPE